MFFTCIFLSTFLPIASTPKEKETLSLTLNANGGSYLQLSNGEWYAIDPNDRIYSSAWITPLNISLSDSGNPKYPVKITNLRTGTSINGRQLSEQERKELKSISPPKTETPQTPSQAPSPTIPKEEPPPPPPKSPPSPPKVPQTPTTKPENK